MVKRYLWLCFIALSVQAFGQANDSVWKADSAQLRKITNEILLHGKCYNDLDYLCNKIGARLSGSPQAAAAVEYTYELMKSCGADTVYLQECMVPHWVRGDKEVAKILTGNSGEYSVNICALGGSICTPEQGITAEVVEVDSWDQLAKLGKDGKLMNKIVFYNRAFDETQVQTFSAYGKAVDQRANGASEAARYGGIASIVRSMTNKIDDNPHTGNMHYNDSINAVPTCAISSAGAELLSRLLKQDNHVKFYFKMNCQTLPDVKSYNVIGEIKGTQHPEEIIAIGGHLDSWDLAQGAQDDGAGAMQSVEVLRTFKSLGIKPKRTIRIIMFMNEENGSRGGIKYAQVAKEKHEHHVVAIETDAGGFSPRGFGIDAPASVKTKVQNWKSLLLPYGLYDFSGSEGGADINHLKDQGVPLMGLSPDSQRYFDYHHAATDRFDIVNKRELELGAASLAMMAYLISEYGL
jgi:hypothetical protein